MAEKTTTEPIVKTVSPQALAEPDPAQRPARLALYVGVGMLILGAIALYLGYDGVAKNNIEVAQTPYLISGGMVGLAFLALGGVTLGVYVLLRVQADLRAELISLRGSIDSLAVTRMADARAATNGASSNGFVLVTKGTSTFHRPDCRLVARSASPTPMGQDEARAAGLTGCRVCIPEQG